METKGYYVTVGIFVILVSAIGLTIALWLSVGLGAKSYIKYMVYMQESVSGLSLSAPVKYNGVDVGFVKKIALDPNDPNEVAIIIAVNKGTPVNTSTRAMLNMQGVTGIAYIELRGGSRNAQPLLPKPGERYAVIPSSPSLLFRMDAAMDRLSENLQQITGSVSDVFNKQNGQALHDTLINIDAVSRNLKENSDELNRIVKNADVFFNNASVASAKFPTLINDAQDSLVHFKQLSHRLDDTAGSVQLTLKQSDVALQTINSQMLPMLMNLLQDVDGVTLRLDDFTQQLNDNPSILIRGKTPTPLGPGEKAAS